MRTSAQSFTICLQLQTKLTKWKQFYVQRKTTKDQSKTSQKLILLTRRNVKYCIINRICFIPRVEISIPLFQHGDSKIKCQKTKQKTNFSFNTKWMNQMLHFTQGIVWEMKFSIRKEYWTKPTKLRRRSTWYVTQSFHWCKAKMQCIYTRTNS